MKSFTESRQKVNLAKTVATKGYFEGAKEWLGAWAKQVSTSVNSHLQGKDHLKRVKELQESRKQRGLKEDRGCRTGLLEMDRLWVDKNNSSNPSSITK